ncbi:MAG: serine/threonine protein kinase [Mycobacterium sp.]|nr:serine/threonine protein kinase [Mycobacterium sp.]
MSRLSHGLRIASAAALISGFAFFGTAGATADPNTGNRADIDILGAAMSKGYDLNNCTPQTVGNGELASLACGQNPDPNGPAQGKYILFGNGNDLAAMFKTSIKGNVLANCGDTASPTVWHQGSATSNAGQVACGTFQDAAEVIWTNDAKKVLSYIRAANTDVPALFQWWRTNG